VAIDCPHCHGKLGEEVASRGSVPVVRCLSCRETLEAPAATPALV
jgi:uncharacterized Zn finger protein